MAGFCKLARGLQAPYFATLAAKMPKVSGLMPDYSRFRETATGDWFRSPLRGGHGSVEKLDLGIEPRFHGANRARSG